MKGVICYYSGSGNTRLACRYIANKVENTEFDLFDIVKDKDSSPDFDQYGVVGFATFTDFVGPPRLFLDFIASLPRQSSKLAFVLGTYGFVYGRTLKALERAVGARGFTVIAGHMLHMPESYPPMIADGNGNEQAPDEKELAQFNVFIVELARALGDVRAGKMPRRKKLKASFPNNLIPPAPRTISRRIMGKKFVDEALCTECGACRKHCPYNAIELTPKPTFDMKKCYGCWACYNHCPQKAIYTKRFRGIGHYPRPIAPLKEKLEI